MADDDPMLTVTQAAAYVNVSEKTIYRLRDRGELTPVPVSDHHHRFRKSDLDAWLKRRAGSIHLDRKDVG